MHANATGEIVPDHIVLNTFKKHVLPTAPSTFEIEVGQQLQALAQRIHAGELHISHFVLTVSETSQRLEVEVG